MTDEQPAAKAPEAPPPPGIFGAFLKEKGVNSERLPDSIGVETIAIDGKDLTSALKLLKESPTTPMDFLVTVSGVDNLESFDSVYHLWSFAKDSELVVKVRVKKSEVSEGKLPEVPSIAPFWSTANWHERETYDLVGIRYLGHPYLRRILNPWDWEGHPLRRDYKQMVDALNDKNPHSFR